MVDRLEQLHGLVNTVHARVATSHSVAAWHTGFHQLAGALFAGNLRAAAAREDGSASTRQVDRTVRMYDPRRVLLPWPSPNRTRIHN